jgi:hypothetical protein
MHYSKIFSAVALAAVALAEPEADPSPVNANIRAASAGTGTTLSSNAIQSGSFVDGTGAIGSEATQAKSDTSTNNFINFCSGKALTNGLQITTGSCNGIGQLIR